MTNLSQVAVDLWLVPEPALLSVQLYTDYVAMLSEDEQERYQSFRLSEDRQRYLVARALMRSVLSGYLADTRADTLQFIIGPHGKPELRHVDGVTPLHFNLSHTRGMLVLAVSREAAVGVDAEMLNRRTRDLQLVKRYFTAQELEEYLRQPEENRQAYFLALWTVKEALVKALGMGLRVPLNSFSVSLAGENPHVSSQLPQISDQAPVCRHWFMNRACSVGLAVCMDPRMQLQVHIKEGLPLQGFSS